MDQMAGGLQPIDIASLPDLAPVVDEVRRTRRPRIIRRDGEDVAVLAPPRRAGGRPRGRVLKADDPLFGLAGKARSSGPGDVSANKHRYLEEAYRAEVTPDPAP